MSNISKFLVGPLGNHRERFGRALAGCDTLLQALQTAVGNLANSMGTTARTPREAGLVEGQYKVKSLRRCQSVLLLACALWGAVAAEPRPLLGAPDAGANSVGGVGAQKETATTSQAPPSGNGRNGAAAADSSNEEQHKSPPAGTPAQTQNAQPGEAGAPEPAPTLTSIDPFAAITAANELLTINGNEFKADIKVDLTDPSGQIWPVSVVNVTDTRLIVMANLGIPGKWSVSARNRGSQVSNSVSFGVAQVPLPDYEVRKLACMMAALIVSGLLVVLFGFVLFSLFRSAGWSLGSALSEESIYQPKEIRKKDDIITFASSSRFIALVGLLGILTTVLGIGYAMMWNLFLYGNLPNLDGARNFLYGSACLFAPYLANQIGSIFSPPAPKNVDLPAAPVITDVRPTNLEASDLSQVIHIVGEGFASGVKLVIADPSGNAVTADQSVTAVQPTILDARVLLKVPGAWRIAVQNPQSEPSANHIVNVAGKPTITGSPPLTQDAAEQEWEFTGTGFVSGLSASIELSGIRAELKIVSIASTVVKVRGTLASEGDAKVVITNPGNYASAPYTVKVNKKTT